MRVKPAIALAALLLAGCTATPPVPAPVPSMDSVETPTAEADFGDDTLFIIAATTTAADGSAVELSMRGYASQAWDARPEVKQSYVDQCTALGGGTVMDSSGELSDETLADYGSSLMVIETTSTPAATTLTGGIELLLGNPFYTVVASGDGLSNPYANECFGGYQIDSTAVLENCVITLTQLAIDSGVADIDGWFSDGGTDLECAIGYRGE